MFNSGLDNFWEDRVDAVNGPVMDSVKYRGRRYWFPERAGQAAMELARYYNAFLPHCRIPLDKRAVRTVIDVADFAVDVLSFVDRITDSGVGFPAGSIDVNPVAWAVFGKTKQRHLARHNFANTEDIVTHYIDALLDESQKCVPTTVFHQEHAIRRIMSFAESLKTPRGFIAAASIMFLRDILEHCGPDTAELAMVFNNTWATDSKEDNSSAWWYARANMVSPPAMTHLTGYARGPAAAQTVRETPKHKHPRIKIVERVFPPEVGLGTNATLSYTLDEIDPAAYKHRVSCYEGYDDYYKF